MDALPFVDRLLALQPGERIELLPLVGLRRRVLVRLAWRTWLDTAPFAPLVVLDPLHASDARAVEDSLALADGGWLYVPEGRLDLPTRALAGVRLVRGVRGAPVAIPAPLARRLAGEDERFHLVSADPALRTARLRLTTAVAAARPIHLVGPPGSGRTSLALWALASHDPALVRPGDITLPPDRRAALFDELDLLDDAALLTLRRRLVGPRPPALPALPRASAPRPHLPALAGIVGESPELAEVLNSLVRVARTLRPVLVLGESGVGKEALAGAVHTLSGLGRAIVRLDLNTIPTTLMDDHLFGRPANYPHRGDPGMVGAFEAADGGTLFLDEVGNLPPAVQQKLLRVLEEGTFQPLGSTRTVRVSVRLVSATNEDLDTAIEQGRFRADLYHRLATHVVRVPPLRDRVEDIPLLAEAFLRAELADRRERSPGFTPEALDALQRRPWPGNVRELRNFVRDLATRVGSEPVSVEALGPEPVDQGATVSVGTEDDVSLRPELRTRLRASTLRIPRLSERPAGLLTALLDALDGRPIRRAALDDLLARDWPDGFHGVRLLQEELADAPPGAAEVAGAEGPTGGFTVVLDPVEIDGQVSAMRQEFSAGALIVGRVAAFEELERDPALRVRRDAIRALTPARPACLRLPDLSGVSRAHLLITPGLEIHPLPQTPLPVYAARLGQAPEPVHGSMRVGRAAEVWVGADPLVARLFVFAGPPSEAELLLAARRVEARVAAATERPRRLRQVGVRDCGVEDPGVRAALNACVAAYAGGDFGRHLRSALPDAAVPDALRAYVLGDSPTHRVAQYCGNLYQERAHHQLRWELFVILAGRPDPDAAIRALPLPLARALTDLLAEDVRAGVLPGVTAQQRRVLEGLGG